MTLNIQKERDDSSEYLRMDAIAIILEFLIAVLITADQPEDRISVRCIDDRFVLSGRPETVAGLTVCIDDAVKAVIEADCLRYAEEVASHLICQTYVRKRSPYGYYDLIDDYSYAPEIQKFIKLTAMYIQKAFDRESEG